MDAVLRCIGDVSPGVRLVLEHLIDEGMLASAVYCESTRSTNSDALQELQSDGASAECYPRLHLTDRQTAGRGRQGNTWVSDEDSLTLSLVVEFDPQHVSAALMSPAIGVATAKAIEYALAPCRVSLKWPNDLCAVVAEKNATMPELRKLGGILIETAAQVPSHVVLGIGLNLNRAPALDPTHSATRGSLPMSLAALTSRSVDRVSVLGALVESVVETVSQMRQNPAEVIGEYRRRCVLSGRDLSLRQNGQLVAGHCTGITDDGSLELLVGGRSVRIRSGEVQRVRFAQ